MGSLDHATLGSVEVDQYCNPSTTIYVGHKDWSFESTIGDNLSVPPLRLEDPRTYDSKPFIEMNLAKMWESTKNFEEFVKRFDIGWLSMYLHLDVRCECTREPVGRAGADIKYKGANEAFYLNNLIDVMHGKKGEDLPTLKHPDPDQSKEHDGALALWLYSLGKQQD